MRPFAQKHLVFLSLFATFVLAGGFYLANSAKADAILFFSANRNGWTNFLFKWGTLLGEAYVYFAAALVLLRYRVGYSLLVGLTGILVLLVSYSTKQFFAYDRPVLFFSKTGIPDQLTFVEGVDLHTGATSFPSGHAMAAFAFYSLLAFLFPASKRYVILFFSLALLVVFSRVYLVQHFWQDVYSGGIIGFFIAVIAFFAYNRLKIKPESKWAKPLGGGGRT
jgi:membrane-associated phospholipid phosphatase